jgi:hypothetical protein
MSAHDDALIYTNVSQNNGTGRSVGFTGGGGITHVWSPCFAGANASIEVHFLDINGQELLVKTYALPLNGSIIGAFGLGTNALIAGQQGTFLGDQPQNAVGFIGYARGASIQIGRCGSNKPQNNASYALSAATTPDSMEVGQQFAWCLVAGAHGYSIGGVPTDSGAEPMPGAIYTGQVAIAVGGTAVQLPSNSGLVNGVVVTNLPTSIGAMYVGNSGVTTSNGDYLAVGASRAYGVNNSNLLYIVNGNVGDSVSFSCS